MVQKGVVDIVKNPGDSIYHDIKNLVATKSPSGLTIFCVLESATQLYMILALRPEAWSFRMN
jgi:hypothetical protein